MGGVGRREQNEDDMRARATGEGMSKKMRGEDGEGKRGEETKSEEARGWGEKGKRKGR